MNFILYSFRRYHQFTKQKVADNLRLSTEEYEILESGCNLVFPDLAKKLSALYKAPQYIFLIDQTSMCVQVFFNNNHFENSNAFVNNQNVDSFPETFGNI